MTHRMSILVTFSLPIFNIIVYHFWEFHTWIQCILITFTPTPPLTSSRSTTLCFSISYLFSFLNNLLNLLSPTCAGCIPKGVADLTEAKSRLTLPLKAIRHQQLLNQGQRLVKPFKIPNSFLAGLILSVSSVSNYSCYESLSSLPWHVKKHCFTWILPDSWLLQSL